MQSTLWTGLRRFALAASLVPTLSGVALGQLALVACFLPLAFLLRASALYQRGIVGAGSALVAGLGSIWLAERVLGRVILGF
jgi:hypothetical protein